MLPEGTAVGAEKAILSYQSALAMLDLSDIVPNEPIGAEAASQTSSAAHLRTGIAQLRCG